jgi:hypothetical protein
MRKDHAPQFSHRHPPMTWPVYKVVSKRPRTTVESIGVALMSAAAWAFVVCLIAHLARAVLGGVL